MSDDRIIDIDRGSDGARAAPRRRRPLLPYLADKGVIHREGRKSILGVTHRFPGPAHRPSTSIHAAATDRARANAVAPPGRGRHSHLDRVAPSWIATVALEKAMAPSLFGLQRWQAGQHDPRRS